MTPAPFLRRYAAWSLDAALIAIVVVLLQRRAIAMAADAAIDAYLGLLQRTGSSLAGAVESGLPPTALAAQWLHDPAMVAAMADLSSASIALLTATLPAFALLGAVYYAGFERSPWQATPGKRALGLIVTDADGRRIGFARALLRHAAGALSWLTLNIGHAMALLPPRRVALHDLMAGTRVIQAHGDARLPTWAKAWLALQVFAFFYALLRWYVWASATMQSALEQVLLG